jgi:septum formation topological specificity factor MinE
MSLKEKIRIVLNQKGAFQCPNRTSQTVASSRKPAAQKPNGADRLDLVVAELRRRSAAKPRTLKSLNNTISALFHKTLSDQELAAVLVDLQARGIVCVEGANVSYKIPVADV